MASKQRNSIISPKSLMELGRFAIAIIAIIIIS